MSSTDLHPLDVGDHVVRQVAAIEAHPLLHVEQGRRGRAELDRNDTVRPRALQRPGDQRAGGLVVGGDDRDRPQLFGAGDRRRGRAQRLDGPVGGLLQPAHQFDRVGAFGKRRQPALDQRVGKHGRRRRAVAGNRVGLHGDLAHHLRAHVLERARQLDLLGNADAIAGNDRRADRPVDHRVHPARPERAADAARQLGHAPAEGGARLVVMEHHFCHFRFPAAGSFILADTRRTTSSGGPAQGLARRG